VRGSDGRHCIFTLVERAAGYVEIKKLMARAKGQAGAAMARVINGPKGRIRMITLDNGTEFHDHKNVED
jgi:transposase, IS30 family